MILDNLLEDAQKAVREAEKSMGVDLVLREEPGLNNQVGLEYAMKKEDPQVITFGPDCGKEQSHLIASKAIQLLRMDRVPFEKRVLPITTGSHLINAKLQLETEAKTNPVLSEALQKQEILQSWVFSLINQVVSQPLDISVQVEIYNRYPELQEQQRQMLDKQFDDFKKTLNPDVKALSPRVIYEASIIMNSVYLFILDEHLNTGYQNQLSDLPRKKKIMRLITETKELIGESHLSDRKITDLWASELKISTWFGWMALKGC